MWKNLIRYVDFKPTFHTRPYFTFAGSFSRGLVQFWGSSWGLRAREVKANKLPVRNS